MCIKVCEFYIKINKSGRNWQWQLRGLDDNRLCSKGSVSVAKYPTKSSAKNVILNNATGLMNDGPARHTVKKVIFN